MRPLVDPTSAGAVAPPGIRLIECCLPRRKDVLQKFPFILDVPGFEYQGERPEDSVHVWQTPAGDWLGCFYFAKPPDIDASLTDSAALRVSYSRAAKDAGLGVLEVDAVSVDGIGAVRTLFKLPQEPTGRTYIGTLTFPFRDFSLVLKVVCPERGCTGIRDTMVADQMMSAGTLTFDEQTGKARGWLADPYDPNEEGPMTRNRSELPEFDAQFPDHPLSQARWVLDHLQNTLCVEDEVRSQPAFL